MEMRSPSGALKKINPLPATGLFLKSLKTLKNLQRGIERDQWHEMG